MANFLLRFSIFLISSFLNSQISNHEKIDNILSREIPNLDYQGKFQEAIDCLEIFKSRFADSHYAVEAELRVADTYYQRKELFKDQWASKLKQEEIPISDQAYETFFNDRLTKGNKDLGKFLEILVGLMERGDKFEIFLKGYASPRASEKYNLILGQRRIFSVKNEFLKYDSGILSKYLANKQLAISEKSFGELSAPKRVPDAINNQRLSVFSLDASQERRVEIVEVKRNK